jgi:hypothetical protein
MAKFYKFFKDLFSKRQEQTAEQKIIAFRNNTARLQEESSGNDLEDELQDLLNRSGAGQSSRPPTVTFEHATGGGLGSRSRLPALRLGGVPLYTP